ncbi:MarR family winged helix-turn-helix transcriptional regulator [Streptomyces sp. NPDC015350]|uniref:MarR family winged helix-turn-helix transcriptional regulator n=1 Tax=Streptomyces sp. NPDC015350 TaxID=3364955 RepID=UPI0037028358
MKTWRTLIDLTADLRKVLGVEMQDVGVSPGDYAVLPALGEAEDCAIRSSEPAEAIDRARSRLSHHLGRRMEKLGPRWCEACDGGRGTLIVLTPAGRDALRNASGPHLAAVKRYFADALSRDELEQLFTPLDRVRTHFDDARGQATDADRDTPWTHPAPTVLCGRS